MKSEEFYKKMRQTLQETTVFPGVYLFKFIVPASGDGETVIIDSFDGTGAVIDTRLSKKGNYIAVSISVEMPDAHSVIDKYKELSVIPGIIPL